MIAGLFLYVILVLPPVAAWLEASMTGHKLVQIPQLSLLELRISAQVAMPATNTPIRFQVGAITLAMFAVSMRSKVASTWRS